MTRGTAVRLIPAEPNLRDVWKTFPARFEGPSRSACCKWPTVLVQSMDGGFVTSNCFKCGKKETLSNADFLERVRIWVACPQCDDPMYRQMIDKNYGFVCLTCEVGIRLADLLPRWNEVKPNR